MYYTNTIVSEQLKSKYYQQNVLKISKLKALIMPSGYGQCYMIILLDHLCTYVFVIISHN